MNKKIAIVEEDENTRGLLDVLFYNQGFQTAQFNSVCDLLSKIEFHAPNILILADTMSDCMCIPEAIYQIHKSIDFSHIPIIVLSENNSEHDKITGLDAGASDYVTKPFGVLELCARVRAQLRRVECYSETAITYDNNLNEPLCINAATHEVNVLGQMINLTLKETELLKLLFDNQDRVLTRNEIFHHVWGTECKTGIRTLDVHVGTLRKKLENTIGCNLQIITARKVGYRLLM